MGTGSLGGGGGGGSARGGGAGPSTSGARLKFSSKGSSANLDEKAAFEEVSRILRHLPKEYVKLQFGNPFLDMVYNEIFYLKTDLVQNKSWDSVEKRLGVSGGTGCLSRWVEKIISLNKDYELSQRSKVIDTIQVALEDFLYVAVVKEDLYGHGDQHEIIKAFGENHEFFNSISGLFLTNVIWRIVEKDRESLPANAEMKLHDVCELKANEIIKAFETKFRHRRVGNIDAVTHQNLFYTFSKEIDWLIENF